MAQKFKNQIDAQEGIKITNELYDGSNAAGSSGQVLSSTGTGTQWIDSSSSTAERIEVTVKNVSGGSLSKGTVVHAAPTATPPSGNVIEVIKADANDAAKMPAIGVLNETIADEAEGAAVMFGAVSGIDTSSFTIGDELYVSTTAGAFTATKPTANDELIQKIAIVIKSHGSNGLIKVFGAGRSNDVPNKIDRNVTFAGNISIESTLPRINLTDTDNNDDWSIFNNNGTFRVYNATDSADSFNIDGNGNVGFNVIPENSSGTWRNLVFGSLSMFARPNNANPDGGIGTNFKFTTASAEQRISAHGTSRIWFNDDVINFQRAGSDTPNSSISWATPLQLDSSNNATFAGSITTTSATGIKIDTTGNAILELDGASGSTEAIIFRHSGTEVSRISHSNSTNLVFSTGSSVTTALTIDSSQNANFAGDITATGGDLTLGTDSIASNINAVGDVLGINVDSNTGGGAGANIQLKTAGTTQLTINNSSATFAGDIIMDGNLGVGTAVADSPIHVSKGGLNTTGQDYGVHIGVLESGADRYSAIEIVSNGALSGWIDFSNTDSANDYNERIRGGDGTLRFFSSGEEAAYIDSSQHTYFNEDIIVTSNDHNITTIQANENSTHFARLHYLHSDFTTSGTNIADSLLLVASSESTGGIVIRADKPGSEIVFAIGDSSIENTVMKITDGANGVEFFPTTTAEGGHIALRADTDGSYRYAIDNYNDTVRIVRQADADATGGLVVASVDENGDFSVTRDFVAGRTGYFTSNSTDSRVLYLDQHATDAGGIVQFRDESDTYTWEVVARNNEFYIYNNGLSRQSLYINPTNNFIGINGNVAPKAFLHVTDGTNSYPTDSNNKLVVESTGHTYIGLGGGDASDVGIHFGDSTNVARGRLAYIHSEDAMKISTNGAVRYTLDGYGNVAYNSTIEQSNGTWRNFGFGSLKMFGRANDSNPDGGIGTNFYFTTANAELRASAHAASRIWFNDDQINFDNAGTGLIDSAITWNNRMFINASGYVGIGATTAIAPLHVDAKDTPYDDANGLAIFQDNGDREIVIGGLGIFRRDEDGTADLRINYIGYNGGTTQPRDFDIYDGKHARIARFDGSTKRVAIGAHNPDETLHLKLATGDPRIKLETGGGGDPGIIFQSADNRTGEMFFQDGSTSGRFSYDHSNESFNLYAHNQTSIDFHVSETLAYFTQQNLVIGNTTSNYDFEVYGTDAKMFAHYTSNSRGGIAAFSSQRIAMTTTSVNDNLVFGYNSDESSTSADFVERMRIDNGTGFVGIGGVTNPQALLSVGSGSLADGNIPVQISTSGDGSQRWFGVNKNGNYGLLLGYMENNGLAGTGGYIRNITEDPLYFMVSNSDLAMTIASNKNITAEERVQVKTAISVFGNNVTDIGATNSPTTTSVNIGTYINSYGFIDISSSNANGGWIDFSNANGTDYGGRIRYNFTNNRMSFSAGTGERFQVNVGTTTALNTLEAAQATYSAFIGGASFSWGGSSAYPTIYGSNADRWVMFTFPHIACLQNGVNWHTGSTTGAKIRFASNPAASSSWDAGVDLQYNAADRFSIGRQGALMLNILPPNSTYSGLASRDWTIFGTGSRAAGIAINDVAGANYAIHGGGNDLTFSKSVNGTSLANALAILGSSNADSSPDVKVYNDLTVDGTASVGNAATITSNTSSRVLYLKQQSTNSGNIVQFQDQSANNTWEVVGRNNIFYIYNNMNGQGFALYINPANNYIGIDKASASYNLDVEGTIRATSDVIAFSDKRVKENIVTIDNALDKVTKLRGVTYTRKDKDDKSTKVGVIAQEVLEVLPEVVEKDDEGMYSVAYGNMAGVFIEAIKELKAEVDSLKEQLKINNGSTG